MFAFPAVVPGTTVTVSPSIVAVAIFVASELTVSSPLVALFVTVNVPLVGYTYVPLLAEIDKSLEVATPLYVTSTSPSSVSFNANLYLSSTIISAFLSSIISLELISYFLSPLLIWSK